MDKKEIQFQNGCKLEFKGFDDSNVRGLSPIIDYSSQPIYEGNEFFTEKFIEENYPNYKELEASYFRYLQTAENRIPISDFLRQYALDSGCVSALYHAEVGRGAIKKAQIGDVIIAPTCPSFEKLKQITLSTPPYKNKRK